jgi:hypothetical protein
LGPIVILGSPVQSRIIFLSQSQGWAALIPST